MKILSSISISLVVHAMLIFPTMCAEKKEQKISAKSFHIADIEIVPSYVKEVEVVTTRKNPHGMVVTDTHKKVIDKKVKNGEKNTNLYITKVREILFASFQKNTKFKKMKLSGDALLKIQIQKDGRYDILQIDSKNSKLSELIESTLYKVTSLPEIPEDTGKYELQLKIPLVFKN